mmetsp:Transcript_81910/g.221875  ORF Transcript_81910/g.221875 Transcript_81910/m.221875 type:complete len:342 (-) Transcript_81910:599-1624(-)
MCSTVKAETPEDARYFRRFSRPVSTTYLTLGNVTDVSATFVATTTMRMPSPTGSKGANCALAGSCAYSGNTRRGPSPKPEPPKTPPAVRERSSLPMFSAFAPLALKSFLSSSSDSFLSASSSTTSSSASMEKEKPFFSSSSGSAGTGAAASSPSAAASAGTSALAFFLRLPRGPAGPARPLFCPPSAASSCPPGPAGAAAASSGREGAPPPSAGLLLAPFFLFPPAAAAGSPDGSPSAGAAARQRFLPLTGFSCSESSPPSTSAPSSSEASSRSSRAPAPAPWGCSSSPSFGAGPPKSCALLRRSIAQRRWTSWRPVTKTRIVPGGSCLWISSTDLCAAFT